MDKFAWLLGLRGVVQHGKRNVIAGFAIAVGLMAITTLVGYATRINDYLAASSMYIQHPGHVAIVKRGGVRKRLTEPKEFSLKKAEVTRIQSALEKMPNFDFAAPYLSGFGLIGNGCKSFPFKASAFSFAMDSKIKNHPELKSILHDYKPYTKGIPHTEAKDVAPIGISRGLAQRLEKDIDGKPSASASLDVFAPEDCEKAEVKSKLRKDSNVQLMAQDLEGRLNAVDADVVNEFTTGLSFSDNSALTMSIEQLQDLVRTDRVSYLAVFLKDREQAEDFARKIKVKMIQQKLDIDAFAWDDKTWNFNYHASKNILAVSNIFAAIVIFIVVILSIINTLNIGLVEARREIGTLRALGYTPSQVAKIFAIEAKIVAFVSVLIGSVASFFLFELITSLRIPIQFAGAAQKTIFLITPPDLTYPITAIALLFLVVFVSHSIAKRYASQETLTLLDRGN